MKFSDQDPVAVAVVDAASHKASLVPVSPAMVPEDLSLTLDRPLRLLLYDSKITRVSAGAPRWRRSRSPVRYSREAVGEEAALDGVNTTLATALLANK